MRFYKQLNAHKPAEGLYGDCFRTCIGCLLDMPPEDVPHFFDGANEENNGSQWQALGEWLAGRNLAIATFPVAAAGDDVPATAIIKHICEWNKDISMLLFGKSKTGVDHVVIIRNGEIFHDPSFLNNSVVGPASNGVYTVALLIPLAMTKVDEEFAG